MEAPWIDYHLLTDPSDRKRQREIIRIARRISETEPLASWVDQELAPGASVQSDEELDAAINASGGIYYHAASTAPMGTDPSSSVVDTKGRVFGITGLVIADASAFPEMISPPVNLTVLMLAERLAAELGHETLRSLRAIARVHRTTAPPKPDAATQAAFIEKANTLLRPRHRTLPHPCPVGSRGGMNQHM